MKRSDITDLEVCAAVAVYQERIHKLPLFSEALNFVPFPYQELAKKFNCDEKLAYAACERAEERGLLEYGVSLRTGWLTETGKALLQGVGTDITK